MSGTGTPVGCPFVIKQVARAWETTVRQVLHRAPYARGLPLDWLKPFRQMQEVIDMTQWAEGGCLTAGDLYTEGAYVTIAEAAELYQIRQGQFLQYSKMAHTVRRIWNSFPTEP